jgi:serine/threonine protein kinase/Tfp pilus assembly protein PilF
MIGQTISHYKILEKLGEGGMGVVYKAEDTKLKRTVALKFLSPQAVGTEEDKTRFLHEAQAAAALNHPNICTVHEIDEYEDRSFIAMECIEGESLKAKIKSGPLGIDEAVEIAVEIAEGLQEAHSKGIVHRDIKSANIMLTATSRVKVMDFGLAKSSGRTQLTRSGTAVGTVAYMSPEQGRGEPVDHRTDIWSLGIVLYEMLTGELPFKADYEQATIYRIINEELPSIKSRRSDVPKELERIIEKALAKSTKERYERIEAFAADLGKLKDQSAAGSKDDKSMRETQSIAVLPFVDMSPDKDQEYFCDGLAEELINALAHIKLLRVAARTSAFSFKGEKYDVRDIGEKLNVDTVLEGSIRKAGNRLRITAQLVSAADGYHLWSEKYDRNLEDIFAIQDEISLAIVDQLKIELLGEEISRLTKRGTEDLEAYDLYILGRFFWEKRGLELKKAVEYFKQAIEKDPKYVAPYAGLADSYTLLAFYGFLPSHDAMPKAREYALKALGIDNTIAEAHSALAYIHQFYDWDFTKAEQEFKRAIELNPAYTPAHYWYASMLMLADRPDEALCENERAIALDPLSVHAHVQYGWDLMGVRQFEQSVQRLNRALELNPDYMLAHWLLGGNFYMLARYENALTEFEKAVALSGRNPWMLSTLGSVYGRHGKTSEAREVIAELVDRSKSEYVQALYFANLYIGLGELDEALAWLEESFEARDLYLIVPTMKWDVFFEDHMKDPRLRAFLEKVKREVIT